MGRLAKKNILIVIPRDFYDEEQLEPLLEILKDEEASLMVASDKLKQAVGMKKGKVMPDVLIVDSVEGITGDSYVTEAGHGTRQIRGVFHGVILIGGNGARKYLWEDKVLRLLISDRFNSGFVVGAIGTAVPTLASSSLLEGLRATYEVNKHTKKKLTDTNFIFEEDEAVVVDDSTISRSGNPSTIITTRGKEHIKDFAQKIIEHVEKTPVK